MSKAHLAPASRKRVSTPRSERSPLWLVVLLPLGLIGAAACSEDDIGNESDGSTVVVGAGGMASGGAAGGSAAGGMQGASSQDAGSSTTMGGGAKPDAGAPGGSGSMDAGGAAGGATADASVGADASTSPDASVGSDAALGSDASAGSDGGPSTAGLKTMCQSHERMGCRTFMSPTGKEIELGPYGAAMDVNVGQGFENTVSASDNTASCRSFAQQFGQSEESTNKLLDLMGTDLKLYSVYRPAVWKEGEKYPVVSWGNGTCAQPEGYATLLRYVASHGFIVVAANSRYVGSGTAQKRALDFIFKANEDSASPYFGKVDTTRVAAMGHSQGSQGTIAAASDARIKSVILFNVGQSSSKPFFAISGDRDIAGPLSSYKSAVSRATIKAAYMWMHMIPGTGSATGHLTLMQQPERLTGATVAWLKYTLSDDAESKTWFSGTTCMLCGHDADFEFASKNI